MPTYTQTIGGKTYTFDSETPLTPEEQKQEATIFFMEDTAPQREHLASVSAVPTKEEAARVEAGKGSMWEGMGEAGANLGYGILNTLAHPINTAVDLVKAQGREFGKAYNEFNSSKEGKNLAAGGHLAAGLFPLIGPMAANVGEDVGEAEHNPRAAGRALVNGSLLLGPTGMKLGKDFAPGVAEFGTKVATEHPSLATGIAGGIEGYIHGGWPGAAAGAIGLPTGLKALKSVLKDVTGKGEAGAKAGQGAAEAFGQGVDKAKLSPNEPPATPSTPTSTPKPPTTPPTSTPRQPMTRASTPDFLRQDVAGWKPGAKFEPATRSLSIPGKGTQRMSLLRGDESVMALAKELGLDIPEGGFDRYPQPEGTSPAAQALRQRASIAGQRSRTRPIKPTKKTGGTK